MTPEIRNSFIWSNYINDYLKIRQKEMKKELEEMFDADKPNVKEINKVLKKVKEESENERQMYFL
jgi:hypothetical protein